MEEYIKKRLKAKLSKAKGIELTDEEIAYEYAVRSLFASLIIRWFIAMNFATFFTVLILLYLRF